MLVKIPVNKPLTDAQLTVFAKKMNLKCFRGVFSKDKLPAKPKARECGIINLQDSTGPGTHWTAYFKKKNKIYFYFDSFGLSPPKELTRYLGGNVVYNHEQIQGADEVVCGQYCLFVLHHLNKNVNFFEVIKKCLR